MATESLQLLTGTIDAQRLSSSHLVSLKSIMKIKSSLLAASAVFAIGALPAGAAAFTGTYSFSGATGNVTSLAYNGSAIPGVTVGNLSKVGITTSSSSGNSRATSFPIGATTGLDTFSGTIDLTKYFEFSLTADSGVTIGMTSVTFGIGRSLTGSRQWEWRSSVDSFAAAIKTYSAVNAGLTNAEGVLTNPDSDSNWTGNVLDLSGAAYDGLSTINLRFYGYNSETTVGTGGLQGNLSFAGTAVPEPAAAILGAFGMLAILRRRR